MLITLYLCVLCGSQNKTVTFVLYIFNRLVFITEVESVYSAVRTGSLNKADYVSFLKSKATERRSRLYSLCLFKYSRDVANIYFTARRLHVSASV